MQGNGSSPQRPTLSSPEAERGLLACAILDTPAVMPELERASVTPLWFDDLRHAKWFSLIRRMHRENVHVDGITVGERIRTSPPETYGGIAYFCDLADACPSAANWPYYLPQVRDYWVRRLAREAGERAVQAAENLDENVETLVHDLEASVRTLNPPKGSLPPVCDIHTLSSEVMDEPHELVEGVLHEGTKLALGGGSKACKTWVLLDLALSVSHGAPWLGLPVFQSPVLFLNLEIPTVFFRRRILKVAREKDIEIRNGLMDVWNLRGFNAPFSELLPKIRQHIKSKGYRLIVLDPIYKMYGDLDENKAGDISRLMNALESLAFESHSALAFAAHFSKGNQSQKESIDRISGSGVFARDPDTILTMTAHEEPNCFIVDGALRNFAPLKPFVIKWKYPLMHPQTDMDATKLKKVAGKPKSYDESKILALLAPKSLSPTEWLKAASNEFGTSRASFYRAIQDLKDANLIFRLSNGNWCQITRKDEE